MSKPQPNKTYAITARFSKEQFEAIKQLSKEEKRSMGNQLVVMVKAAIYARTARQ